MKTIRIISCTAVLLLVCFCGNAQRFKGGVHIGLLATQVDGDNWSGYKKPGLFVGVFGNLPFEEKQIKLQLEINYAQKGSRNPSWASFRYRIATHQIEMPVLFGWNFWKGMSLEVGPSFNILASAKEYLDNVAVLPDANGSKFNFFELGGVAGIDYLIKEHFGLSFRMNYSLSPIGRSVNLRSGSKLERYMWSNAMLFRFYYQF